MNKIDWSHKALKQVKKLDHQHQFRISDAVEGLSNLATCSNIMRLIDHEYDYRLRVGNYRVFFDLIKGKVTIVKIQEVKKRNESTY